MTLRDLAHVPLPAIAPEYAQAITDRQPCDADIFRLSEMLIGELEHSELLVILTPIHNLCMPASLKLWIDYVVRAGRTFRSSPGGKIGLLKDRPTRVLITSGGFHLGPSANQPDFLSPYLTEILGIIGIRDVRYARMQGTACGWEEATEAARIDREELRSSLLPLPGTPKD